MKPFVFKTVYNAAESRLITGLIVAETGLSRTCVKDAMAKGAVWLSSGGRRLRRIRRIRTQLKKGDRIHFYFDENVLRRIPPLPVCIRDEKIWSGWFKPAGLLTQGTRYGDHCAILRQAEIHFKPRRPIFPVHRLDPCRMVYMRDRRDV